MSLSPAAPIASVIVIVGGVGLALVHNYAGNDGDPEGWLAASAFAAPFVMAGVLALFGVWRGRSGVVAAAGIALVPISIVSVVMWPILVPAAVLIVLGLAAGADRSARENVAFALVVVGLPIAFALLLVHNDPVSWVTPDGGGGSSSDVITNVEALGSLSITAMVSAAAPLVSWRRR